MRGNKILHVGGYSYYEVIRLQKVTFRVFGHIIFLR